MTFVNRNFINFDGSSVAGRVPTRVVEDNGVQLNDRQRSLIESLYTRFANDCKLSVSPTLSRSLVIDDGLSVLMSHAYGLDTVRVSAVPKVVIPEKAVQATVKTKLVATQDSERITLIAIEIFDEDYLPELTGNDYWYYSYDYGIKPSLLAMSFIDRARLISETVITISIDIFGDEAGNMPGGEINLRITPYKGGPRSLGTLTVFEDRSDILAMGFVPVDLPIVMRKLIPEPPPEPPEALVFISAESIVRWGHVDRERVEDEFGDEVEQFIHINLASVKTLDDETQGGFLDKFVLAETTPDECFYVSHTIPEPTP